MNQSIAKLLIYIGSIILAAGLIYYFFWNRIFPPGGGGLLGWIGKLPGDINYQNGNNKVFFPITTCIVFTLIINILAYIIKRYF